MVTDQTWGKHPPDHKSTGKNDLYDTMRFYLTLKDYKRGRKSRHGKKWWQIFLAATA